MVRRFSVPVFVAALILGVAPSPSFGLGAGEVRPRFDDHYQCMYRCDDRGDFRPPSRPHRLGWGSWPPRPRPRPPTRPSSHRPGCWLFCGSDHGGWGGAWSGPHWWCGPGPFFDDGWYRHSGWHGRPCRPHGYGGSDHDRYDRHRDRDEGSGYDAHRSHPRGRDF
jgi:hypothetical protein